MPQKKKPRRQTKLSTRKLTKKLSGVEAKLRKLSETGGEEITDDHVDAARDIATELQEINRGFREALKRAMMADGKIKPGQTITAGGRYVFLKLRPGRSKDSTDPDDYDLMYEAIH